MATLYIEEYQEMGQDHKGNAIPGGKVLITNQKFSVSGTSAQSAALNASTRFVRLVADATIQWKEGENPTADSNSRYLPSGVVEYFCVTGGNKIAAVTV